MWFVRRFAVLWLSWVVCLAAFAAEASSLSVADELAVPTSTPGVAGISLSRSGSGSAWDALPSVRIEVLPQVDGPATLRGTIGLFGPVGAVIDYADSVPQFRGVSFSPNESVRIEATGSIDGRFGGPGGQIMLRFEF